MLLTRAAFRCFDPWPYMYKSVGYQGTLGSCALPHDSAVPGPRPAQTGHQLLQAPQAQKFLQGQKSILNTSRTCRKAHREQRSLRTTIGRHAKLEGAMPMLAVVRADLLRLRQMIFHMSKRRCRTACSGSVGSAIRGRQCCRSPARPCAALAGCPSAAQPRCAPQTWTQHTSVPPWPLQHAASSPFQIPV